MQATSSTNWRERLDDKKIIDGSILFSIIVSIAIVALGGWLTQFELAHTPADDIGFFYEWQLAEATAWGQLTAWVGFCNSPIADLGHDLCMHNAPIASAIIARPCDL
jgi:hypothetical protein